MSLKDEDQCDGLEWPWKMNWKRELNEVVAGTVGDEHEG